MKMFIKSIKIKEKLYTNFLGGKLCCKCFGVQKFWRTIEP